MVETLNTLRVVEMLLVKNTGGKGKDKHVMSHH
jgi:hypothetical protein